MSRGVADEADVVTLLEHPHRWFPPPYNAKSGEVDQAWRDILQERHLLRLQAEFRRLRLRGLENAFGTRRKYAIMSRCRRCRKDLQYIHRVCRRCYAALRAKNQHYKFVEKFLDNGRGCATMP